VRRAVVRDAIFDVASRLSFFLWNSIPDDRLLDLAQRGTLTRSDVLEPEVRRMLADPRASRALVDNFAAQWLNLRRVHEVIVHPDYYPDFDDSLLNAFEDETRLFLDSTLGKIAASTICCAPTTRSSTNVWRVTTAFQASTAVASGA
jgi:hypothetical protein